MLLQDKNNILNIYSAHRTKKLKKYASYIKFMKKNFLFSVLQIKP